MNLSLFLLVISLIILAYLSLYALIFLRMAFLFLFTKSNAKRIKYSITDRGDVTVLIPAFNEGKSVVDTVNTILKQNYAGQIEILFLVKDAKDSSANALVKNFNIDSSQLNGNQVILHEDKNRKLILCFTDLTAKKDKINAVLSLIDTPYAAIIDADHRPTNNWISSSLCKLIDNDFSAVQTKRAPLSVLKFAQLWDSAQNHIGNEVFNATTEMSGRSVFFTGTSCLFKSDILKEHRLSDCITEDTVLSYQMLVAGKKIGYNSDACSYEEVAPNLSSYVLRRRRWSHGHTYNFFTSLKSILTAPIKISEKIQLLFHGQFYLVPLMIVALYHLFGLFLFLQYPVTTRLAVLFSSLVMTAFLPFIVLLGYRQNIQNFVAGFLWIFPLFTVGATYILRFADPEVFYSTVSFPYERDLTYFHIALLLVPLFPLFSGRMKIKEIPISKFIFIVLSYPLIIFLDIYACLIGLIDLLTGRRKWDRIKRHYAIDDRMMPDELQEELQHAKVVKHRKVGVALFFGLILSLISFNEFFAVDNCGQKSGPLWDYFIFKQETIDFKVQVRKSMADKDHFDLNLLMDIRRKKYQALDLTVEVDQNIVEKISVDPSVLSYKKQLKFTFPIEWKSHELNIILKNEELSCTRQRKFSGIVKELRNKKLFVNGEPFLLKGVVPSFINPNVDLDWKEGFKQIKKLGANAVRFYHQPSADVIQMLEQLDLFFVDQPHESTWSDVNVLMTFFRNKLYKNYRKLVTNLEGNPYLLFHHLGNELEVDPLKKLDYLQVLQKLLKRIRKEIDVYPLSYSTYYTFMNYDVDILGINMLDSGNVYWEDALDKLSLLNGAFYASEFGGFVAMFERVPQMLRADRILRQWQRLLDAGALGGFFFQSHDNWAQPVMHGFNDPFTDDEPDDTRGVWDKDNNPKLSKYFLSKIYADLSIKSTDDIIAKDNGSITLLIKNIRPYRLNNVEINYSGKKLLSISKLSPQQEISVRVDAKIDLPSSIVLGATYKSHHGLKGESEHTVSLPVRQVVSPTFLNSDILFLEVPNGDGAKGCMVHGTELKFILPEKWESFSFNGKEYRVDNALVKTISVPGNPYYRVEGLMYSTDGQSYRPYEKRTYHAGLHMFRFSIPQTLLSPYSLMIFRGTGDVHPVLYAKNQKQKTLNAHPYRDLVVPTSLFDSGDWNESLLFQMNRNGVPYVPAELSLAGETQHVYLDPPIIFSPFCFELNKL